MDDISRKSKVFYANKSNKISLEEKSKNNDINENQNNINHSGNSNVNVNVNVDVDTTAIAFAMLCSSLAKKELTNEEFEFAVNKLEELTNNKKINKSNPESPWRKILFNR